MTADRNASARREVFEEQESAMSQPDATAKLRDELRHAPAEPLLPVEKKLIAYSLGIGLALLAVLMAVNHFVPVGF
jgi:hypothetical protein